MDTASIDQSPPVYSHGLAAYGVAASNGSACPNGYRLPFPTSEISGKTKPSTQYAEKKHVTAGIRTELKAMGEHIFTATTNSLGYSPCADALSGLSTTTSRQGIKTETEPADKMLMGKFRRHYRKQD